MKNNATYLYSAVLVVGDFIALVAAFVLAYFLRFRILDVVGSSSVGARGFSVAILSVLPLWILVNALLGLYSQNVYEKRFSELGRLGFGSIIGMLTVIGYDFFSDSAVLPGRLIPVYAMLLGFVFLVCFRSFVRIGRKQLFRYNFGVNDVLVVGNTESTRSLTASINDTLHSGQRVVGVVGCKVPGVPYFENFEQATQNTKFISIIQTELYRSQEKNNEILRYAHLNHVSYRFIPGNTELFSGNITIELFDSVPMVAVHQTALTGWGRISKRLFDVVVSLIILLLLSPVMLLFAIIIKLSDLREPVFFRQIRLTRFNHEFRVFKFRSVKHGLNCSPEEGFAKLGRPDLLKQYRDNGDYLPGDPRFTRIGRFMRATSVDELPQLFNVLLGDLSLVGPRTLVPQELNTYSRKHAILSVKAGITGLAQVSGRKDISFEERRRLDVYYVQNWSFWLDIVIMIKTLRVMFTSSGDK
jgi:exopolysaccharide biosynthesis polyprenyl glycosylphosphotransferase